MTIQYSIEWTFYSLNAKHFNSFSAETSTPQICSLIIKSVYNQVLYKYKSTFFKTTIVNILKTPSECYLLIMSGEAEGEGGS